MIFINNRYTTIYYQIISIALRRNSASIKVERHHIIPESFFKNRSRSGPAGWIDGDPEELSNIVFLTTREHAFCHKLLVKMTEGKMKSKMVLAIWRMLNGHHKKLFSSRDYENYRNLFTEHIKTIHKGRKRKSLTKNHRENISKSTLGVSKTSEAKHNMKIAWEKRDRTVKDSTRKLNKIASTKFWESPEVRNLQSIKRTQFLQSNPSLLQKQIKILNKHTTCEHCGISTNSGNYKRWHGLKCKLNKLL